MELACARVLDSLAHLARCHLRRLANEGTQWD
jgi:hypothetical protein